MKLSLVLLIVIKYVEPFILSSNQNCPVQIPWIIMKATVKELKQQLRDRSLPVSGNKAQLLERLKEAETLFESRSGDAAAEMDSDTLIPAVAENIDAEYFERLDAQVVGGRNDIEHSKVVKSSGITSPEQLQPQMAVEPKPVAEVEEERIGSVSEADLSRRYDLLVVGGGPAGVAGAVQAAQLGKRVLIVDKPKAAPPGGGLDFGFGGPTGLFSKALRDVGKTLDMGSLSQMGLDNNVIWQQVTNNCVKLASNNAKKMCELLKNFRVHYLQGDASLTMWTTLDDMEEEPHAQTRVVSIRKHADGQMVMVTAKKVLICTGSKPIRIAGIPFDGVRIFDSDTINGLNFLPSSIVISGSGIIAIEYAKIFRKFGADVTMLVRGTTMSALERIGLDTMVAERLLEALAKDDIKVLENRQVEEFLHVPDESCDVPDGDCICRPLEIKVCDRNGNTQGILEPEIYMAATGRAPFTKGSTIRLENAGVKLTSGGYIDVDSGFQSVSARSIYAAGDCIEGPALASTGVDQAQRAVQHMFGSSMFAATESFPIGMWTTPEIGYYGLTLPAALEKGYNADEGVATYDACLRGRVFAPDGMLKLVFDKDSKRILGVHIIGTDACEMVHYGMDLVEKKATVFDVISTLFTAVTFHELFKEAALDANSKLKYGIAWQTVLHELDVVFSESDSLLPDEALHRQFDEIDVSGNGSISALELKTLFEKLGKPVSLEVIENLVHLADTDNSGEIDWEEFEAIYKVVNESRNTGNEQNREMSEMHTAVLESNG